MSWQNLANGTAKKKCVVFCVLLPSPCNAKSCATVEFVAFAATTTHIDIYVSIYLIFTMYHLLENGTLSRRSLVELERKSDCGYCLDYVGSVISSPFRLKSERRFPMHIPIMIRLCFAYCCYVCCGCCCCFFFRSFVWSFSFVLSSGRFA